MGFKDPGELRACERTGGGCVHAQHTTPRPLALAVEEAYGRGEAWVRFARGGSSAPEDPLEGETKEGPVFGGKATSAQRARDSFREIILRNSREIIQGDFHPTSKTC